MGQPEGPQWEEVAGGVWPGYGNLEAPENQEAIGAFKHWLVNPESQGRLL